MADYNRFISYIYLYERGIKTINTGFAKVESRGGQCRMNVMMKNMYHESHVKFSVYMFVRKGSKLVGLYLGDMKTENNTGEFDAVTDTNNIEGSGYSLEQVAGMIIRGDNGKIYGTGWDDDALNVDAFVPLEQYREGDTYENMSGRQAYAAEDNGPDSEVKVIASEESEQEPVKVHEEPGAAHGKVEEVHEQPEATARGEAEAAASVSVQASDGMVSEVVDISGKRRVSVTDSENSQASAGAYGSSENMRLMAESMEALARSDDNEASLFRSEHVHYGHRGNSSDGLIRPSANTWQNGIKRADHVADNAANKASDNVADKASDNVANKAWDNVANKASDNVADNAADNTVMKPSPLDKLLEKGLRMYPFEDNQVLACIRMEPQDIGTLPMKYWQLANNSFLLHGYYSYRHLVLAKMSDGRFILGIPGVNYQREQFMAGMFGFGEFKPVQDHVSVGNEFGYWYMELEA